MTNISRIWLFLLKEGGRWTTPEIGAEVGMTPATVMSTVNAMWLRKYVQRHEIPGWTPGTPQYQYSVNAKCTTPSGLLLEHLVQAGMRFAALEEGVEHVR